MLMHCKVASTQPNTPEYSLHATHFFQETAEGSAAKGGYRSLACKWTTEKPRNAQTSSLPLGRTDLGWHATNGQHRKERVSAAPRPVIMHSRTWLTAVPLSASVGWICCKYGTTNSCCASVCSVQTSQCYILFLATHYGGMATKIS